MRTVFFVVLDGLGDEPIPQLGGRTPLEAAETPHLDRLASFGALGTCTTVGPGVAPESDIAVMALLGYEPSEHHPGRGPVEAIGAGVEVADGDLAWRCNFATVGEWPHLEDRRAGRDLTADEASELARLVSERVRLPDADFEFRATVGHRAVLRIRSRRRALSASIGNTDPAYERRGTLGVALEDFPDRIQEARPVGDGDEGAALGADLTNRFTRDAHDVLAGSDPNRRREEQGKLPANVVLCRDAGDHIPDLQPIGERHDADFACFVEMPVEAGIAAMTGMASVDVGSGFDDLDAQYRHWARTAEQAADEHDVLYIHIKGPDIPAHDGRWDDKRSVIEAIDRSFFGAIDLRLDRSIVLVTADHATSCLRSAHTDAPVPVLVAGPPVASDDVGGFSERASADGALGHRRGIDLMPLVVDLARR